MKFPDFSRIFHNINFSKSIFLMSKLVILKTMSQQCVLRISWHWIGKFIWNLKFLYESRKRKKKKVTLGVTFGKSYKKWLEVKKVTTWLACINFPWAISKLLNSSPFQFIHSTNPPFPRFTSYPTFRLRHSRKWILMGNKILSEKLL